MVCGHPSLSSNIMVCGHFSLQTLWFVYTLLSPQTLLSVDTFLFKNAQITYFLTLQTLWFVDTLLSPQKLWSVDTFLLKKNTPKLHIYLLFKHYGLWTLFSLFIMVCEHSRSSLFNVVVCGHCLMTLPLTIYGN